MNSADTKALAGVLVLVFVMALLLSVSAGTLSYWQAWVFLAIFGGCSLVITVYLMKRDPALLQRRLRGGPVAEKGPTEKIIQSVTALGFIAMLVVPALDRRFQWSHVPSFAVWVGDFFLATGFILIFFVYKQNTFASATVEIVPNQRVISTGLYAFVRHPMYLSGLPLFLGMPLALGSWWGLLPFLLMFPALIWRIFDEEKLLADSLPGYREYCQTVRYRLVPFVW